MKIPTSHQILTVSDAQNLAQYCFAVIKMSQFAANPSQEHLDKAMYIFQYLAGTQNYHLVYKGGSQAKSLMAFTDSDWAADLVALAMHWSTTGYFALLASGIISLWT